MDHGWTSLSRVEAHVQASPYSHRLSLSVVSHMYITHYPYSMTQAMPFSPDFTNLAKILDEHASVGVLCAKRID